MHSMTSLFAGSELLLLFATVMVGLGLARVTIAGITLGPSAVLFAGLAASALIGADGELRIAHQVKELGLVLFVYSVGLSSGPAFFSTFRQRGVRLNVAAVLALTLGAGVVAGCGAWLSLDAGYVAGLFSGALTNTPALGAASARLAGSVLPAHAALAYSVTYPFGVLGAVLLLRGFSRYKRDELAADKQGAAEKRGSELGSRNFEVTNDQLAGRSIGELRIRDEIGVVVSRKGRPGDSLVPTKYTRLERGDVVTAVGPKDALDRAQAYFGAPSLERLESHREHVDMRRILVSRRELVGKKVDDLELDRRFNAQVTRLRRGDLDLFPSRDTRLQLGDRLRVVAPVERLPELSEFFGDSQRELSQIDMTALSLGLALGLVLAQLPLPVPGGTLSLGIAGGPLLAGLVLGQVGRTGRLVWSIPYEASTTLRELGLVVFLAAVGVGAGAQLRTAELADGLRLFGVGALVTAMTSAAALWLFSTLGRARVVSALGACTGVQTQPAALAVAHEISGQSEETYVAYAIVYPVAMVTKIVLAQLLTILF